MKKNYSLSGMPDFNILETKRRNYLLSIIKHEFEFFGFSPIVTSGVEKRSNLIGSYGEEGDKLVFQILNSGDYLSKIDTIDKKLNYGELSSKISTKALRYDLTLPFARFVAKNQSELTFPFKRYEIGKVWRADRPQKGRLREFIQCDADIIGDQSLWLEYDLILLLKSIFKKIGLKDLVIKINNRKILEGVFKSFNNKNLSFVDYCIIIDKINKIGLDKTRVLFLDKGFEDLEVSKIIALFELRGSFSEKRKYLLDNFEVNQVLQEGLNELDFIFNQCAKNNILEYVEFDLTLARGLDYYTGFILEVISSNNKSISLAGGGRYDNLTEKFGSKNISGVGVSIGLDRLYLEVESLNLFPPNIKNDLDVLFVNFGQKEAEVTQVYISKIRNIGKSVELYPSETKISKQMTYANKRLAKFVVIIGENELHNDLLTIKNMQSGIQKSMTFTEFKKILIIDE